jgi:hypothetical protein
VLVEKLPEEKRELYASVPTDVLEDIVASLEKGGPTRPDKPGGGGKSDKPYEEMTSEEVAELKSGNFALYKTKYTEWYKRKNGTLPPFPITQ